MLFKSENIPTDKEERTLYCEILTPLQEYKSAYNDNIWTVVWQKLQIFSPVVCHFILKLLFFYMFGLKNIDIFLGKFRTNRGK